MSTDLILRDLTDKQSLLQVVEHVLLHRDKWERTIHNEFSNSVVKVINFRAGLDILKPHQKPDPDPNPITGSAFCIYERWFLTNYHVVQDAARLVAENNQTLDAKVPMTLCASWPEEDVAFLICDEAGWEALCGHGAHPIRPFRLGDSSQAKITEHLVAIGYAYGANQNTLAGKFTCWWIESGRLRMQMTVPINQGCSGCPIILEDGTVGGMAVSGRQKANSVTYAIPSNTIKALLPEGIRKVLLFCTGCIESQIGAPGTFADRDRITVAPKLVFQAELPFALGKVGPLNWVEQGLKPSNKKEGKGSTRAAVVTAVDPDCPAVKPRDIILSIQARYPDLSHVTIQDIIDMKKHKLPEIKRRALVLGVRDGTVLTTFDDLAAHPNGTFEKQIVDLHAWLTTLPAFQTHLALDLYRDGKHKTVNVPLKSRDSALNGVRSIHTDLEEPEWCFAFGLCLVRLYEQVVQRAAQAGLVFSDQHRRRLVVAQVFPGSSTQELSIEQFDELVSVSYRGQTIEVDSVASLQAALAQFVKLSGGSSGRKQSKKSKPQDELLRVNLRRGPVQKSQLSLLWAIILEDAKLYASMTAGPPECVQDWIKAGHKAGFLRVM